MKWLLGTYTSRFNRRQRLSGHLFGGRYQSLIVDGSAPEAFSLAAGGAVVGEYCIGRDSGQRNRSLLHRLAASGCESGNASVSAIVAQLVPAADIHWS